MYSNSLKNPILAAPKLYFLQRPGIKFNILALCRLIFLTSNNLFKTNNVPHNLIPKTGSNLPTSNFDVCLPPAIYKSQFSSHFSTILSFSTPNIPSKVSIHYFFLALVENIALFVWHKNSWL